MTPAGWAFLALSWGFVIGLCVFCLRRMFRRSHRR
jgi:hypothetical protein